MPFVAAPPLFPPSLQMAGSESTTIAAPAALLEELDGFGGLDEGVEEEEATEEPLGTVGIAEGQYGGECWGRCSIGGNGLRVYVRFGASDLAKYLTILF